MATRAVFTSSSPRPLGGGSLVDNIAAHITSLFNAVALVPTSISNSGDDYTIVIDPVLDDDVVNNMTFWITPNAVNSGAARLRVTDPNPFYPWVKADGSDFALGDLDTATTYGVVFTGGAFKTVTSGSSNAGGAAFIDYQEFTASGTWIKPEDLNPDAWVFIEIWAGGGGGGHAAASAGGGGGGGYNYRLFKASDLSLTETVTIGAGGAAGSSSAGGVGGTSTFGSILSAFGGGGGFNGDGTGGGGGGQISAGATGAAGSSTGRGGNPSPGAATGGSGNTGSSNTATPIGDGIFGGGAGAGNVSAAANGVAGANSLYGGGGGGSDTDGAAGAGGTSVFGGNGGIGQSVATAGTAPAGGGGGSSGTSAGAGARGECRVWVLG